MPEPRSLLVLDIDDTQIPDRNRGSLYSGEEQDIERLRHMLDMLAADGHVVAHVTNGIFEHYTPVQGLLADPHYVSCAASTKIYRKNSGGDGAFVLDQDHQNLIAASGFDPVAAMERGKSRPQLVPLESEHQSNVKISFRFCEGLSLQERQSVHEDLVNLYQDVPGTAVQYVEGNGEYYIDFLPAPCTKGENVLFIAARETISPENIVTFGNGNNDIDMFRGQFRCAAVGNAVPALMRHVESLAGRDGRSGRYIVTQGIRARGVMEALHRFNLL